MSKDTGGPAFPALHSIDGNWVKEPLPQFSGMTLRDYFAAKAMQGILCGRNPSDVATVCMAYATHAYLYADAMLAERAK